MEIGSRRTRQRQAILEVVRRTTCHPSAQWVYEQVRQEIPHVSLGTVYRNLELMSRNGSILQVPAISGQARYDGDVSGHGHISCRACDRIDDLFIEAGYEALRSAAEDAGFRELTVLVELSGRCPDCAKNGS